MVDKKIISEWINKAEEDFLYACASLDDNLEFFSQICFLFQQSAEKYLKAYIIANELDFRKIHNLIILLKICSSYNADFSKLHTDCEILNRYYVDSRYPVHWPSQYTRETAEEAKEAAKNIRDFIREKICS